MAWFTLGEDFLGLVGGLPTWTSSISATRKSRQQNILWHGDYSASCLSVFPERKEGLERSNHMGCLAISSFQLTLRGPEELWPNLFFKETTNKCQQSVSKASIQLLVSWSPLHRNVCLNILVTAERGSQSRWPIQTAISVKGKVPMCTPLYSNEILLFPIPHSIPIIIWKGKFCYSHVINEEQQNWG